MKNLYIAVETKVRELDAKLLIACAAADQHIQVYIGNMSTFTKWKGILNQLPNGVLLFPTASHWTKRVVDKCKKDGHQLIVLHEEGLVFETEQQYVEECISADVLNFLKIFYCIGDNHLRIMNKHFPDTSSNYYQVGNPRFDLLRPEMKDFFQQEVKKLQRKHGKFILINTHFAMYNHFHGEDYYLQFYRDHMVDWTAEKEKVLVRRIEHVKHMFLEFKRIIPILAEQFNEYKIIIRPHPGESIEAWGDWPEHRNRIAVIHEGNVIPWIIASELVLHSGCTTGIEAFVLNKPVVSYLPVYSAEFDELLPNDFSHIVYNLEALLSTIQQFIGTQDGYYAKSDLEKNKKLERYITGIKLEEPFAAESIVSVIRNSGILEDSELPIHHQEQQNEYQSSKAILKKIYWAIRKFKQWRPKKRDEYELKKFPKTTRREIVQKIKKISQVTGRYADLRVEKAGNSAFRIYKKWR